MRVIDDKFIERRKWTLLTGKVTGRQVLIDDKGLVEGLVLEQIVDSEPGLKIEDTGRYL